MSEQASYDHDALVAAVLADETELVINRGSLEGISEKQRYLIYIHGGKIIDPETKEDLGPIEIVIGHAIVVHVQERIATLRNVETTRLPDKRRVFEDDVYRLSGGVLGLLGTGSKGRIKEEIIPGETVTAVFKNPVVGAYVRRTS